MINYQKGDMLLVSFPFGGSSQSTIRPALVLLDTGDDDVVLARVTTSSQHTPCDVPIQDWQQAGLLAPSVIRLHKMVTVEKTQIIRTLRSLQPADHQQNS